VQDAVIVVRRARELMGLLAKYTVFVDGNARAQLRVGGSVSIPVEAGHRVVEIRHGRYGSPKLDVEVGSGVPVSLTCGGVIPGVTGPSGRQMLRGPKDKYYWLTPSGVARPMDQRRRVSRWRVLSEAVISVICAAFSIGSAIGGQLSSALGMATLCAALTVKLMRFDLPLYRQQLAAGPAAKS
jgi:hypothetical protein